MKQLKYLSSAIFVMALVWGGSVTADGQTEAQAHVAAAKAAVSPKTPNPQPWHIFNSAFNQMCAEPKPGARPQPAGKGVNRRARAFP